MEVPQLPAPRLLPASRMRHVLAALGFASCVCVGLWIVRFLWAHPDASDPYWKGKLRLSGLNWNLILAWIPLGLSIWMRTIDYTVRKYRTRFWSTAVVWLLFYPNSLYLVTDLIHTKKFGKDGISPWYDMMMTAAFACGGVFLGSLSLYLLHLMVRERFGFRAGWIFAVSLLALGSFGIYLGRFLRLNSWDVIRPVQFLEKVQSHLVKAPNVFGFTLTMFLFSFMAYWFVVAIARLHEDEV